MAKTNSHSAAPDAPIEIRPAWSTVAASPLIYGMSIPLVFLDLCLELYHRLAFPLLGIPTVRRGDYIRLDRYHLPYLPVILKIACAYCGYANGLFHYAMRIAGETEAYFCPIKHQASSTFHAPPHQAKFAKYDDREAFRRLHRE